MAAYYCYECLRKFNKHKVRQFSGQCSFCKCELRKVKNVRTRAQVVTRLSRLRGLKPPSKKSDYQIYLASDLWKEIRGRVLNRDDWTCRDCGEAANQVHHLSYAPAVMAGEDDSKLVSLCRHCHEGRHPNKVKRRRKPRQRRTAQNGNERGHRHVPEAQVQVAIDASEMTPTKH